MARTAVSLAAPARRTAEGARAASAKPAATLSRRSDTTLAEQLTGRYAELVRQRLLAPGARLPSVRECARRHAVSPATVVSAYDQLLARGLVEARPHRGFFVRTAHDESTRAARSDGRAGPATPAPPRQRVPNSATALIRGMFQPPGGRPMPGLGTLPAEWLDPEMLAAAMRKVTAGRNVALTALQYGDPAGETRLRDALALKLADHGIAARPGARTRPTSRARRRARCRRRAAGCG